MICVLSPVREARVVCRSDDVFCNPCEHAALYMYARRTWEPSPWKVFVLDASEIRRMFSVLATQHGRWMFRPALAGMRLACHLSSGITVFCALGLALLQYMHPRCVSYPSLEPLIFQNLSLHFSPEMDMSNLDFPLPNLFLPWPTPK